MFRWGWERYVAFLNLFVLPVVFLKKFKCYILDMFFCWIPLWVYSYPYKSVDGVFPQVLSANLVLSIGQKILGWISEKVQHIICIIRNFRKRGRSHEIFSILISMCFSSQIFWNLQQQQQQQHFIHSCTAYIHLNMEKRTKLTYNYWVWRLINWEVLRLNASRFPATLSENFRSVYPRRYWKIKNIRSSGKHPSFIRIIISYLQ